MNTSKTLAIGMAAALSATLLAGLAPAAQAQDVVRKPVRRVAAAIVNRPLIIGGRRGPTGIIYRDNGNEIYAPGGFSAHGYGWGPPGSERAERAARNADVAYRSANTYLGLTGIGATGFGDRGESGYNNPYYGNSYNQYVGYNGVPADLAFGPAFANRHITADEDPIEGQDGYSAAQRNNTPPLFGEDN